MSMLVCKQGAQIQQLSYSQHGWNEVRDCEQPGQCSFDENGHPIVYVGKQHTLLLVLQLLLLAVACD